MVHGEAGEEAGVVVVLVHVPPARVLWHHVDARAQRSTRNHLVRIIYILYKLADISVVEWCYSQMLLGLGQSEGHVGRHNVAGARKVRRVTVRFHQIARHVVLAEIDLIRGPTF